MSKKDKYPMTELHTNLNKPVGKNGTYRTVVMVPMEEYEKLIEAEVALEKKAMKIIIKTYDHNPPWYIRKRESNFSILAPNSSALKEIKEQLSIHLKNITERAERKISKNCILENENTKLKMEVHCLKSRNIFQRIFRKGEK